VAHQEHLASQDLLAAQVREETLDLKAHLDQMAHQEKEEDLAHLVLEEKEDLMDLQELQGELVDLDQEVNLVH